MRKLNSLMMALSLTCCFGQVAAADTVVNGDTSTPTGCFEVSCFSVGGKVKKTEEVTCITNTWDIVYSLVTGRKGITIPKIAQEETKPEDKPSEVLADVKKEEKRITLSEVNQMRRQEGVPILIALPTLPEGARPGIASFRGGAGLEVRNFKVNGITYDLWKNYDNWDLEKVGGVAKYTYAKFGGSFEHESWYELRYFIKKGDQPGESDNVLVTNEVPGFFGKTVYVLLGEVSKG